MRKLILVAILLLPFVFKCQIDRKKYLSKLTSFGNVDGTTNSQLNERVYIAYSIDKAFFNFTFLDRSEDNVKTFYFSKFKIDGQYSSFEISKNNDGVGRIILSDIPEGKCFALIYHNGTLILFGPTVKQ